MPKRKRYSLRELREDQQVEFRYRPSDVWLKTEMPILENRGRVKVGSGRLIGDGRPEEWVKRSSGDSTDKDSDFGLRPVLDMFYQASRVVSAINFNKPYSVQIARKRSYLNAFEDVNLCYRCKAPIEVRKTRLSAIGKLEFDEAGNPLDWRMLDLSEKVETNKPKLHTYDTPYWRIPHFAKRNKNSIPYADIPSHFEWDWNADGSAYCKLIDGSGRDIRLKRYSRTYQRPVRNNYWDKKRANGSKMVSVTRWYEEFVHRQDDGTEIPVVPNSHYRVTNLKCDCVFRRPKQVAV